MTVRILASLGFALATLTAALPAHAGAHKLFENQTSTIWRIDNPPVNEQVQAFPEIEIKANDHVTITAGGCVQTGGHGSTWKSYVHPKGAKSDRFYHGTIRIPGVTSGDEPVGEWTGHTFIVPSSVGLQAATYPFLGYKDDYYPDNGYWGHDFGTSGQCRDEGNAWVMIRIDRGIAPLSPARADLNLVSRETDPNGLQLDPVFQYSETHPGQLADPLERAQCNSFDDLANINSDTNLRAAKPICTSQVPSTDVESLCEQDQLLMQGHVNTEVATVEGTILKWGSLSSWLSGSDYTLWLSPDQPGLLTRYNQFSAMEIKFASTETVDHFDKLWWNELRAAVDSGASNPGEINGKRVVVTGLVGLDCLSSCVSQIHPVYMWAVHLYEKPDDDAWAVFARNWGTEGFCSEEQHEVDVTLPLRLFLRRNGPHNAQLLLDKTMFYTDPDNSTNVLKPLLNDSGKGAQVSLFLPDASKHAIVYGEVHIRWNGGTPPEVPAVRPAASGTDPALARLERAHKELAALSAEKRASLLALKPTAKPYDKLVVDLPPSNDTKAGTPHRVQILDLAAELAKLQRLDSICNAIGFLPGLDVSCAAVRRALGGANRTVTQ